MLPATFSAAVAGAAPPAAVFEEDLRLVRKNLLEEEESAVPNDSVRKVAAESGSGSAGQKLWIVIADLGSIGSGSTNSSCRSGSSFSDIF